MLHTIPNGPIHRTPKSYNLSINIIIYISNEWRKSYGCINRHTFMYPPPSKQHCNTLFHNSKQIGSKISFKICFGSMHIMYLHVCIRHTRSYTQPTPARNNLPRAHTFWFRQYPQNFTQHFIAANILDAGNDFGVMFRLSIAYTKVINKRNHVYIKQFS